MRNILGKGRAVSSIAMIAIIVIAIIAIPLILSMAGMRSGFIDIGESITIPSAAKPDSYYNSAFLPCRSAAGGTPCPEGTFCDGASRGCVAIGRSNL
jgi:hypothetical protein